MKTYLTYLLYLLNKKYKENPANIFLPIWFIISFTLMFGGTIMFGVSAYPGNFASFWWLTLTLAGIISSPFIVLPIAIWIEEKYNNYQNWKSASNLTHKTEANKNE
jgi:hypothetical protein